MREQKYIPGDRVFEGESLARPRTGWLSVKVKKPESKILSVHQNLAILLFFAPEFDPRPGPYATRYPEKKNFNC
jgi:hypothetical protein